MLRTTVTAFAAAALTALPVDAAAQGTRFLRDPDINSDRIVFVHASDLWVVDRAGGRASRLTSDDGAETDPAFSPDGRWIAFSGEYGGNQDVYVVAAAGGQPQRLTWHPSADVVQGWTPDGRVLFQSGRKGQPTKLWQWYTVDPAGGLPEDVGVPQAFMGEMSADGAWLAYQEIGFWDPEWRNHRGGQAKPISIVSATTWERVTPPWERERQMAPVWLDGVVYYISERDYAANVWSFDPATNRERQLTFHSDFDVKSLGAGGGTVVYEQAGYLHELDPSSGSTRPLQIMAEGDQNWARTRWVDVPATQLSNARLSPTGKRALFEHRGDIFTAPADEGSWRNLTRSSGVADRHPVWSPDGSRIAWFNDDGGEYGLVVADQNGADQRRIELAEGTFYFFPEWSPDGRRIAFTDTDYRVLIIDLETERLTVVDGEIYADPRRSIYPVWSPDSRYIAYARRLENLYRALFVHDVLTGETHQVTDGMADVLSPEWDPAGEYLYFLASTDFGMNAGWLDMTAYDRPVTRTLWAAILHEDTASPFVPKADEEEGRGDGGQDTRDDGGRPERNGGTADASTTGRDGMGRDADPDGTDRARDDGTPADASMAPIDFAGLADRIVHAPGLPARDYQGVVAGPTGHVFVTEAVPNEQGATLHRYDVDDQEATEFADGVSAVVASADHKKVLMRQGPNWSVVDAAGSPPQGPSDRLTLDGLRMRVEPQTEWSQMLRDGWRFMRDFLYVDNAHGAPWDDVWDWYSAWLPDVQHRSDFNHLLDMLSGEISVGHSYVRGGDYPDLDNPRTGLLGADLEQVDGWYRIARIYDGEAWTPGVQGPLAHPGMNVREGDWLVAIDGRPLQAPTNPYELLEGSAGRTITVSVNTNPTLDGARDIVVEPVGSEGQLRSWAWVEDNRRTVDEMSDGRLAYVYLPNTGQGGYRYFNRMYFAQQDRQGAVIDERNNGGGSAADYMVEVMDRELFGYFNSRVPGNRPFTQPMTGLFGPKVMIINGRAGSGGDLLPYLFKFHEVGPLVGTRTWGGLVHTADTPPLIDGGRFVAPRGGFYDVNGEWAIEGVGVAPDIEVHNDPAAVRAGRDPQLEAAVAEALRRLETERVEFMSEPPPPVRYRRPIRREGNGR